MTLIDLKKAVDAAVKAEGENAKTIPAALLFMDEHGAKVTTNAGGMAVLERAEIVRRGGTAFCLAFG
jgi:hypothetical protein